MNDMTRKHSFPPKPPLGMATDVPARLRPLRAGPFGVLDIGTSKVVCLIGRVDGDGLRVLGLGHTQSRGVRGGGIVDLEAAEGCIRAAVGEAEKMADHRLRSVTVNLTCGHPESRLFDLQWPVGNRSVTEADVRRVVLEGLGRAFCEGRDTIHALPLSFAVDDTQGVADPRGLHCDILSARLHVVDAGTSALRNLQMTLERCELELGELVSSPMASGMSTLVEDERQLGATCIDMGGGATSLAVFSEGQLLHTAQLPVGGNHVTNDVARLLSTPVVEAERLKTVYGNAEPSPDDEREILTTPLVGEEDHDMQRIPRSRLVAIIKPRLEETFELVRDRLDGAGLVLESGTRVVLTGGASQLGGAREMASRILGRQVRLGRPAALRGLPDRASGPVLATAAGLLIWATGSGRHLADMDLTDARPTSVLRRFVSFLRDRV